MNTITIPNLLYEEVVLLQNIMWYISNHTEFTSQLDFENSEIYESLYDKVMKA